MVSFRKRQVVVGMGLLAATLAAFPGVAALGFVFDDFHYVAHNPVVSRGLSWQGVRWAFTTAHGANWHPLTWLSHMVDVTVFGLAPGGHHMVSLFLHLANALLVFALLQALTGALWRPALVAALFALHPLRVESVAWVAERKDVLSAFLGLLTLVAYTRYVRVPSLPRAAVTAGCYALGLLAKPMLVTLPLVMLLLDWWPLGRIGGAVAWRSAAGTMAQLRGVLLEKQLLLLLAAGSSLATLWAQGRAGAIVTLGALSLEGRLANAVAAYARYLTLFVWPHGLALPYPLREAVPPGEILAGMALLSGGGVLAFRARHGLPYLGVGFLWFLGMLFPVIGLVQVGSQAGADRYTYLPLLGVAVAVAWGAADLAARARGLRIALVVPILLALAVLCPITRAQVAFWKDELTLFERALQVTSRNAQAHNNLGVALEERGRADDAERHYRLAMEIDPLLPVAHLNLGAALRKRGRAGDAERHLVEALVLNPASPEAHVAFGELLVDGNRPAEGLVHFREALRLDPDAARARELLAEALAGAGSNAEAAEVYRVLARSDPGNAAVRLNLGVVLAALGRAGEAEQEIREALRLDPASVLAHRNLAVLLEGSGRVEESIEHYRESVRLAPDDAIARTRLGELLAGREAPVPPQRP